ncbi:hypothetical protein SMICM304S_01151 [Streptomyces microflavus]
MAGSAVVALVVAGFTFQTANASDEVPQFTVKTLSADAAGKLATTLDRNLGADAAGSYYDTKTKALVVDVVDQNRQPEQVRRGGRQGQSRGALPRRAEVGPADPHRQGDDPQGTSWAVDPVTNKVLVTADSTVDGAAWKKLSAVVEGLGGKAELNKTAGEFKPLIAGGDAIWGSGSRCSLGFNVVKDGEPYFLTAGHCTESVTSWPGHPGRLGSGRTRAPASPRNDYGLVKYTSDIAHPSEVNLYNGSTQAITQAGDATVGQAVTRSGSTTQVHDGEVTALNATVNYGNGDIVNGLIQTDRPRRTGRQRRRPLRGRHRARPDLGRQRRLLLGRHDLLPAGSRGARRLRGRESADTTPRHTAARKGPRSAGGLSRPGRRPSRLRRRDAEVLAHGALHRQDRLPHLHQERMGLLPLLLIVPGVPGQRIQEAFWRRPVATLIAWHRRTLPGRSSGTSIWALA